MAGLAELVVLQRDVDIGRQAGLYIVGENTGKEHAGNEQDQQYRTENLENRADGAGNRVDRHVDGGPGNASGLLWGLALAFLFVHRSDNTSFGDSNAGESKKHKCIY